MTPKIKERAYTVPGNKPFTVAALRVLVRELKDIPEKLPVFMWSDEEGNAKGKLWEVEVASDGVYLRPAEMEVE